MEYTRTEEKIGIPSVDSMSAVGLEKISGIGQSARRVGARDRCRRRACGNGAIHLGLNASVNISEAARWPARNLLPGLHCGNR